MGVKVYDRPLLPVPIKWVVLGIIIALAAAASIYFFVVKEDEPPAASSLLLENTPAITLAHTQTPLHMHHAA